MAEESGGLIGIGQVKPHRDGSRELASIAVVPEWQGLKIGTMIVQALVTREPGLLHLMCASRTVSFYQRLGFQQIEQAAMPPYFRRFARIASVVHPFIGNDMRLAVMRRVTK